MRNSARFPTASSTADFYFAHFWFLRDIEQEISRIAAPDESDLRHGGHSDGAPTGGEISRNLLRPIFGRSFPKFVFVFGICFPAIRPYFPKIRFLVFRPLGNLVSRNMAQFPKKQIVFLFPGESIPRNLANVSKFRGGFLVECVTNE